MKKTTYHLTAAQREEIVARYRTGEKVDAIAADYGVGREYPGKLAHRRGEPRRDWRGPPEKDQNNC